MAIKLKNNAAIILSTSVAVGDIGITLGAGEGAKFEQVSSPDYFYATFANSLDDNINEIVKVTDVTGDTLTLERGAEGTTPQNFIIGDTFEQRVTSQTLYDLLVTSSNTKREYIDDITISIKDTGAIDIYGYNQRQAPTLINNWDIKFGNKFKCTMVDTTNGIVLGDNLRLLTINDIIARRDTNISLTGGNSDFQVSMKVYNEVDPNLPIPSRCYGMNRFLGACKGKKMYGKTKSHLDSPGIANTQLVKMFNAVHGLAITGAAFDEKSIWISTGKKNIYTSLHIGVKLMHNGEGGDGRVYYDTGAYGTLSNGEEEFERLPEPPQVAYLNGANIVMQELSPFGDNIFDSGASRVLVYALRGTTNPTRLAIMLKPIGMDNFLMELPDFNNYTLEAVGCNDDLQSNLDFNEYSSTGSFSNSHFDTNGGKMRINIQSFSNAFHSGTKKANNNHYSDNVTFNTIRFRYRNKTTGITSNLSSFGLRHENLHKFNTHRVMITNFYK